MIETSWYFVEANELQNFLIFQWKMMSYLIGILTIKVENWDTLYTQVHIIKAFHEKRKITVSHFFHKEGGEGRKNTEFFSFYPTTM